MIYVTGDTHGERDLGKLLPDSWPSGYCLTRDDYLVVCGDFGGVWSPGSRDERVLGWWESRPWTTLFVDGNHENHDIIDAYPVSERFGGRVQVVPGHPHVIHLMRGHVYDLSVSPGKASRCLVMGGASSPDRAWRIEGESWWDREMPSEAEYDRCTASLEAAGWRVDYVLTHELPCDLRLGAYGWRCHERLNHVDRIQCFLQWVWERLDRERLVMWYAGHYHVDRMVAGKCRVLFQDVVRLGAVEGG